MSEVSMTVLSWPITCIVEPTVRLNRGGEKRNNVMEQGWREFDTDGDKRKYPVCGGDHGGGRSLTPFFALISTQTIPQHFLDILVPTFMVTFPLFELLF